MNPATTTTVSTPNSTAAITQPVTFVASVAGANPTGVVTFADSQSKLGTVTLSGGQAAYTTASLAVGTHGITATFSGDANNVASTSGSYTFTVVQAATQTALGSSPNPAQAGQPFTLTATVTSSGPPHRRYHILRRVDRAGDRYARRNGFGEHRSERAHRR